MLEARPGFGPKARPGFGPKGRGHAVIVGKLSERIDTGPGIRQERLPCP